MPRSKRRNEKQFGRENNPSQFSRTGGFEQTGTGYRNDDEQRRFGNPAQGRFREGRQEYGHEGWRDTSERSTFSQGREWPGYRGSEYGRAWGSHNPSQTERQDWYRGYPGYQEPYRETFRGEWEPSGRERESWNREEQYDTSEYSGYPSSQEWSRGQQGRYTQGYGTSGQPYRWGTSQGRFSGRGPQGYKRSDERIMEDVNEMLTQDPDIDATFVTVEVRNGEVTLTGSVTDREAKRRAEDIAESVSGVREVQNQLRVRRADEGGESETKRDKSQRQQIAS